MMTTARLAVSQDAGPLCHTLVTAFVTTIDRPRS